MNTSTTASPLAITLRWLAALGQHTQPRVLLRMALVVLLARPLALFTQNLITNQTINGNITNLIRWQSHWHVVRQSWTFFQNDFAGRIANRIMQTGPSLRDSIVSEAIAQLARNERALCRTSLAPYFFSAAKATLVYLATWLPFANVLVQRYRRRKAMV